MTSQFVSRLKIAASGRNVLIFLVLAMSVYSTMIIYTIPGVKKYAPHMELFDLSPMGYTFSYSMRLLEALGVAGRDTYLYTQLPLDFVYPALFAISFCLLMAWVISKGRTRNLGVYYVCVLPIVVGILDYLENIQIILMIRAYPDITERQVMLASVTTVGKSVLTTLFFVIMVISILRILWVRRLRTTE